MSLPPTILVVEDDQDMRSLLEDELGEQGHRVLSAADGREALALLEVHPVDLVITDLMMSGMKGSELLAAVRAHDAEIPVVIMTAFGSIESAVDSMKAGAFHYLAKPFRMDRLIETVAAALHERKVRLDLLDLKEASRTGRTAIVAESSAMRRVLELVRRAAHADSPFLILGESGTGKELLAQALHLEGPRRDGPFVAVNCSAIPETLLESQLFGHKRGAFTDAREDRRGLFQEAAGGTILLDEIGDMPPALQSKLLRVLQQKEVHPLGAPAPVPVDIRAVAATHRDLDALVAEGRFRQDLYYRLNVIAVRIPPLRERPDDLLPLVAHFLHKHGSKLGRAAAQVSPEVIATFRSYRWPGNVRELENVLERALVLGLSDAIGIEDLPEALRAPGRGSETQTGVRMLAEVEREQILKAMRAVGGNKAAAARLLGLDRKTLYRKLDVYGIRER